MKCIQMNVTLDILRVEDDTAHTLVRKNHARYVPRHIWKTEVRGPIETKKEKNDAAEKRSVSDSGG